MDCIYCFRVHLLILYNIVSGLKWFRIFATQFILSQSRGLSPRHKLVFPYRLRMMSQSKIREELKRIREDSSLSEDERRRQCQGVMARISTTNWITSNFSKECPHYNKKCSQFVFDCCNITDPCNRCHQARECCRTHPPRISSITCDECGSAQEPSPSCVNCGIKFSRYHCPICKIWSALDCYHCYDCGLCRVGQQEESYHCPTCDTCFYPVSGRDTHVCLRVDYRNERCCYCLEPLFATQKPTLITHCCTTNLHSDCTRKAGMEGNYRCPRCRKSLFEMQDIWDEIRFSVRAQPLPEYMFDLEPGLMFNSSYGPFRIDRVIQLKQMSDNSSSSDSGDDRGSVSMYSGTLVEWMLSDGSYAKASLSASAIEKRKRLIYIWCNDCERKSLGPFHYLGLECRHCKGFNTCKA